MDAWVRPAGGDVPGGAEGKAHDGAEEGQVSHEQRPVPCWLARADSLTGSPFWCPGREEQEIRRQRILRDKEDRQAQLLTKAENLSRIRKLAHAQAQLRKEQEQQRRVVVEDARREVREKKVVALHGRMESKREAATAERARIAAEEKRIRFEQSQQAASKDAVEELKFGSLREGAEREARERQESQLAESRTYEETRSREQSIHLGNTAQQMEDKERFIQEYDARVRIKRRGGAAQLGREQGRCKPLPGLGAVNDASIVAGQGPGRRYAQGARGGARPQNGQGQVDPGARADAVSKEGGEHLQAHRQRQRPRLWRCLPSRLAIQGDQEAVDSGLLLEWVGRDQSPALEPAGRLCRCIPAHMHIGLHPPRPGPMTEEAEAFDGFRWTSVL